MSRYSTEHPLAAQPSWFDVKAHPVLSFVVRAFVVALVLCPLFNGIVLVNMPVVETPDVPLPSWTDPIEEFVGFFMNFPTFHIVEPGDPGRFSTQMYYFIGVTLDGIFWAIVSAGFWRMGSWWLSSSDGQEHLGERSTEPTQ